MQEISLISTNARGLYHDDILRVINLPNDYVMKFRYQKKYILEDIISNQKKYINKEAVIVYAAGDYRDKEQHEIEHYAIRKCTIVEIVDNEKETGRFDIYIRLKEYVRGKVQFTSNSTSNNDVKLMTSLNYSMLDNCTWQESVDNIKDKLKEKTLIKVDGIKNIRGKQLKVKYDKNLKISKYNLCDDAEYILDIIVYTIDMNDKIKYSINTAEVIQIYDIFDGKIETTIEKLALPISIKRISVPQEIQTIDLKIDNEPGLKINIGIRKNMKNTIMFAIASIIFAISVNQGKALLEYSTNNVSIILILHYVVIGIVFIISTGILFHSFDKK